MTGGAGKDGIDLAAIAVLPPPPEALGLYEACVMRGGVGMLSGQFPVLDGRLLHAGAIGRQLSLEEAGAAARRTAENCVARIARALNDDWRGFGGLLRLDCYAVVEGDAVELPAVLDEGSRVFRALLGDFGRHARSAMMVARLPLGAPLEFVVSFACEQAARSA